jgi:hypothetical protein
MTDRLDAQFDGQAAGDDVAVANLTVGAEPTNAISPDSLAIAKAATARVAEHCAWVGPLIEAIACGATPGVKFATKWGGSGVTAPTPDEQRHDGYVAYIRTVIETGCPWLLALLDAAGATVIVSPGFFCYMVATHCSHAFDIPELLAFTYLTPWADPEEVSQ